MRKLIILTAVLSSFFLIEGQSGSSGADLPLRFSQVRTVQFVKPDGKLKSVRVLTWNIDHGAETNRIADELAANPAELCLLQEVDWRDERSGRRDVAAELSGRLQLNEVFGIEFEELSQERGQPAYIGQATLTRLPVTRSRVLRLQRQSGFWKPRSWLPSSVPLLQRRLGDRIALVTELRLGDRPLIVYNLHLESRSAGMIQAQQLNEVLVDAARYAPGTAIILGGDLNTKYLPSIFLHRLERQGFRSATGERIERTHTIAMALDWIFIKGPLTVEDGNVRYDIKGSDHYPLYATVTAK